MLNKCIHTMMTQRDGRIECMPGAWKRKHNSQKLTLSKTTRQQCAARCARVGLELDDWQAKRFTSRHTVMTKQREVNVRMSQLATPWKWSESYVSQVHEYCNSSLTKQKVNRPLVNINWKCLLNAENTISIWKQPWKHHAPENEVNAADKHAPSDDKKHRPELRSGLQARLRMGSLQNPGKWLPLLRNPVGGTQFLPHHNHINLVAETLNCSPSPAVQHNQLSMRTAAGLHGFALLLLRDSEPMLVSAQVCGAKAKHAKPAWQNQSCDLTYIFIYVYV